MDPEIARLMVEHEVDEDVAEKARTLRDLQSSQSADLKALKQSILHEAFSGVL